MNVLTDKTTLSISKEIERLRQQLLIDNSLIEVTDFGAGPASGAASQRKISTIARTSLSPAKYSLLYSNIIRRYNCRNILELGTSLGINTLYLASERDCRVSTFEGSSTIADVARGVFQTAAATNIKIIEGNIGSTLPDHLKATGEIDFIFIDANHRYQPTIAYFNLLVSYTHEKSVIVVDDIHYSDEMEKAWTEIKKHPRIHHTIDLYRCGILLFNPSVTKQEVVLQF